MNNLVRVVLFIGLMVCNFSIWSDTPSELRSVTLQLKWKHQFQFAGYYAAKEKGLYKEVGLDVKIVEAIPGIDPIREVIAGRAEFGVGTSELILNRYHGDPVVVLGVVFQHSPLSLISLVESGIDNIHKLGGRRVMIEPSSAELFAYLYQEGFTKKAFQLQTHSFHFDDLLTGKTEAMSVYVTDELYELKQKNRKFNQFTPRMGGIDFYGDNFFTIETELLEHPQEVEAFRDATIKGWRYAMQNQEEIIQLIYKSYSQRHSINHLRFEAQEMHELMQPELIDPGYMNPGRWQHMSQTYHKLGLLPEYFNMEAMLFLPNPSTDLKKIRTRLYYTTGGLSLLVIVVLILFRFYRSASINESRLKIMLDNTPISMIVLDNKNRIQSWNAEAEKTFQWKAEEILGKSIFTIVPAEIQEEVNQIIASVHDEFSVSHHQNRNLRKDGSEILCEWLNAPFRGKHDRSSYIICMARDITEKKRLEQELEKAAHYDNLTSLPNRALILDRLKYSISAASRKKSRLAILFLDLNGFKNINDTMGHEAGDTLLQITAQRLKHGIRESDHIGRLGGDEFLVILPEIGNLKNAEKMVRKLKKIVARPSKIKNVTVNINTSVGISIFPDDASEINELIHWADQHMYKTKKEKH